jgi:hypothetical protein
MNDLVNWSICGIIVVAVIFRFGRLIITPKSDAPRIKRDYESGGGRVLSIKQAGFELGGRSSPSYRKYDIVVQHPINGRRAYLVGVQDTLFGDPELKQYGQWAAY